MPEGWDAEPRFADALFRQKRKKGTFRLVAAPPLEGPVADTHAHVHMLTDPVLALERCAVWGVDFVCDVVDACEDPQSVFEAMPSWLEQAQEGVSELVSSSASALAEIAAGGLPTRIPNGHEPCEFALRDNAPLCAVPKVRFAIGCHPHNAKDFDSAAEERMRALLHDPRVCAVGEVGLDYHYDLSPRPVQREVFRRQIRIAHEAGLPLALHIREAHDEAFAILEEEGFAPAGTLLHCFDLDWNVLLPWLEAGCFVALGGAFTFNRNEDTRLAVAKAPLNRLLTETDSPYMTPEPMRGMECGPAHTIFTAARMAEVLGAAAGLERKELLAQLHSNAISFLDREATSWQRGF